MSLPGARHCTLLKAQAPCVGPLCPQHHVYRQPTGLDRHVWWLELVWMAPLEHRGLIGDTAHVLGLVVLARQAALETHSYYWKNTDSSAPKTIMELPSTRSQSGTWKPSGYESWHFQLALSAAFDVLNTDPASRISGRPWRVRYWVPLIPN